MEFAHFTYLVLPLDWERCLDYCVRPATTVHDELVVGQPIRRWPFCGSEGTGRGARTTLSLGPVGGFAVIALKLGGFGLEGPEGVGWACGIVWLVFLLRCRPKLSPSPFEYR